MPTTRREKHFSSLRKRTCADDDLQSGEFTPYGRTDQELLLALRAGSSTAFERLQKLYSNRLYKRILSITRNHEDAEDALQDTFMRAFLAFDSFQGRSHVSSWLMRIAINSALIILRRRRFYVEVSINSPGEARELDIRDSAPTPEEVCDIKQRFDRMSGAIEKLDPKARTAIRVRITQECSMKEMANTLDVSVATVKARLHRARKSLARIVDIERGRPVSQTHADFEFRAEQRYA